MCTFAFLHQVNRASLRTHRRTNRRIESHDPSRTVTGYGRLLRRMLHLPVPDTPPCPCPCPCPALPAFEPNHTATANTAVRHDDIPRPRGQLHTSTQYTTEPARRQGDYDRREAAFVVLQHTDDRVLSKHAVALVWGWTLECLAVVASFVGLLLLPSVVHTRVSIYLSAEGRAPLAARHSPKPKLAADSCTAANRRSQPRRSKPVDPLVGPRSPPLVNTSLTPQRLTRCGVPVPARIQVPVPVSGQFWAENNLRASQPTPFQACRAKPANTS